MIEDQDPFADGGALDASLELTLDAGLDGVDAGDLPSLDDAPKSVKFGAVLVRYSGAQGAKATRQRASGVGSWYAAITRSLSRRISSSA